MSKVSYSTYVNARLTGFESHVQVPRRPRPDAAAFPRYAEWNAQQQQGAARIKRYACMGPVRVRRPGAAADATSTICAPRWRDSP